MVTRRTSLDRIFPPAKLVIIKAESRVSSISSFLYKLSS